jgi:hypothetical protein
MYPSLPLRAVLGFVAAALAVLTFHQGMVGLLYALQFPGITAPPYSFAPIPPLGVPRVFNLCFWGGLYGIVFGILSPKFRLPFWLCGFITGLIAVLVGTYLVPTIKGLPMGGSVLMGWVRSILINGSWGVGLGLIFPQLAMRLTRG